MTLKSRRRTLGRVVRSLFLYAAVAATAIYVGETLPTESHELSAGVFWLSGDNWWGPDGGRCAFCGEKLVPEVDESSACRHCTHCDISFRHSSLPKTLEEQARVWK